MSEFLEDSVTLSNKYCPNHYTKCKPCCPEGRCWYDEQKARRAKGLKAFSPDGWNDVLKRWEAL